MPAFKYTPTSINARTIVGGSILASYFVRENGPLSTRPYAAVTATRIGKADQAVRSQPKPAVWRLRNVLSAINQSDLAALHTMFNEAEGAVYLRITDGDSVVWRTTVVVQAIEPVIGILGYDVVLYVPDPTWEADVLITDSELNKTSSPVTMGTAVPGNKTPAGDRRCSPTFTFTADVVKGIASILDDQTYTLRGFLVNRAPKPLTNVPVWLFDSAGAAARLNTNSSATGATVLQTTGLTSITVDIAAGASTITLASVAGWPAVGMGFLTDSRGVGSHDQFYYTSIIGLVLQGVVWLRAASLGSDPGLPLYTAGGIAHTQAQETAIQPSGIMASGDDLRVAIDDAPNQNRSLVAWHGAGTVSDVVVNVTLPAAIKLTLSKTMISSINPGVGETISFDEGVSALPPAGFLVIDNEVLHYSAKSGRGVVLDGARGLWGSFASSHAVGGFAYANPHRYMISVGYARAGVAPTHTLAERAACQLAGSNNKTLRYGDQADDPSTVYFDAARPQRAASWVPGFDADGNTVSPLLSIAPDANGIAGGNVLTFKDDVPGDGSPVRNYAELTVPQGIDAGITSAIINDWTPANEILNLELFTRDAGGVIKLQDQRQQTAALPAQALPVALSSIAYGLKLKGRYNVVTGGRESGGLFTISNASNNPNVDGCKAQKFTLAKATVITGATAKLSLTSGSTPETVGMQIFGVDGSGLPDTVTGKAGFMLADVSVLNTTPTVYRANFLKTLLPAGEYTLVLFKRTLGAPNVQWTLGTGFRVQRYVQNASGVWQYPGNNYSAYHTIEGTYSNDGSMAIGDEQPILVSGLRTGTIASFDKTIITLEPSQYVYVHREAAFSSAGTHQFHLKDTIANATTGESIVLDKWCKPTTTFTINCLDQTATYIEEGISYPSQKAITPSDFTSWLSLKPGVANAVTYTDPSLISPAQLDMVTTYRALKV